MTLAESTEAITYFQQQYEKARTHYALPTLHEWDQEFDSLEFVSRQKVFSRSIVRFLRWHMMEVINGWAGYLHGFILPNPQNAAAMEEYNYLDDKEKQTIVEILNWIMYRNRGMNMLQLNENDDGSAAFVIETYREWLAHKAIVNKLLEKNMNAWKNKIKK
jgi:hypothetical protein